MTKFFMVKYKKLIYFLGPLFMISAAISVYLTSFPNTLTHQVQENLSQINTTYDYKAKVTPNILYPNGGIVDAGNMIFKKITTEIPINLQTRVYSELDVSVTGTHEVQLLLKAGEYWERIFPLETQQTFEQEGTEITLLNYSSVIDLDKIKAFIMQIEEEIGIKLSLYTIEVIPNIQGVITHAGKEMDISLQDKLVFQYQYDIITRISENKYSSLIPFITTQVTTNTFQFFGNELSLISVQIASILLTMLLLSLVLYITFISRANHKPISQVDKINKKYKSRMIAVTHKLDFEDKTILSLDSFDSIVKIADEKELPILFFEDLLDQSVVYFLVDGDCMFSYEARLPNLVSKTFTGVENDKALAVT